MASSDQLRDTLNGFGESINADLVMAHSEAISKGEPVITHPSLDVKLLNGHRFTRQYRRVLAPLYLPDGQLLVANFSQNIQYNRAIRDKPPAATSVPADLIRPPAHL